MGRFMIYNLYHISLWLSN